MERNHKIGIVDIIALRNIKDCGNATINKICNYVIKNGISLGSPTALNDIFPELRKDKIVTSKLSNFDIYDANDAYRKAENILSIHERLGIKAVSLYDNSFPEILKSTINENGKADVPIVLFYKGDISATELPSISIIGTREPTDIGKQAGRFFGKVFAEKGFNIVSGLALGCDTSGHEGALDAKGITTAFLAHGLDTVYPPQNTELAENILGNGGILMSEHPAGTPVSKYSLVARDRLQAGMSMATIVIQTGVHGGTMHAANTTLLAHKPLYVVKYKDMSITQVQGNISLSHKGGEFITSSDVDNIIDKLTSNKVVEEPFKDTLF